VVGQSSRFLQAVRGPARIEKFHLRVNQLGAYPRPNRLLLPRLLPRPQANPTSRKLPDPIRSSDGADGELWRYPRLLLREAHGTSLEQAGRRDKLERNTCAILA
jgi:hypothetical protein